MPAGAPEGYNAVSPYLVVKDAERTIRFLVDALDGTEIQRYPGQDGKLIHAEVRVADSVIMLADGVDEWPPQPAHVHVYVPDVDTTYRRCLDVGAISVQEPVKKDDPDKRGGVQDPGGTTWWISTRVG